MRTGNGFPSTTSHLQHRLAEINADGVTATLCQSQGQVPGAAAYIERPFSRLSGGKSNDLALPPSMQTQALHVIDQVIALGDTGKQIRNPAGAFFSWDVIAHGPFQFSVKPISHQLPCT